MTALETASRRRLPTEGPFVVESFKAAGLRALTVEEEKKISQGGVSVEGMEQRGFDEVEERERESLRAFFGKDIDVPALPDSITAEQYERWKEMKFELHYLPDEEMSDNKKYPGWKKKPGKKYSPNKEWGIEFLDEAAASKNGLSPDNLKLPGKWILVDTRETPAYQDGNQKYPDD